MKDSIKIWFAPAVLAATLAFSTLPAHAEYIFSSIINNGDPTFNQELGINHAGTIAGYFGGGTAGHPNKGYTVLPPYGQANFTNENFPGSTQTQVTGINDAGVTVGFWSNSNLGAGMDSNFGFADVGGVFSNINNPDTSLMTPFNQLLGVNNSNIAVGVYTDAAGLNHGYTYTIAADTFSANINDPNAGTTAGLGTTAAAINNSGEIVGFYVDAAGVTHGFTDDGGVFTTIDPTGSTFTQLLGINDNGLADGEYVDATGDMHGLLYNLMTNSFQTLDDPAAAMGTTLNGINDLNQLVGFYVDAAGSTVGLIANPTGTVPEPSLLSLLAAGLFALMAVRCRRQA